MMGTEGRNYRLCLGLPDITDPYLGKWLTPSDNNVPIMDLADTKFTFDQPTLGAWVTLDDNVLTSAGLSSESDSIHENPSPRLVAPEIREAVSRDSSYGRAVKSDISISNTDASGWGLVDMNMCADQTEDTEHRLRQEITDLAGGEPCRVKIKLGEEVDDWMESKFSELWLHAGKSAELRPSLLQWEVSHVLEEMFHSMGLPESVDKIELDSRTWGSKGVVTDSSDGGRQSILLSPSLIDSIQETDLVRAALSALQGVPTAVTWLEQLAGTFASTAADRSPDNIRTLWLRSSSTSALSKVLKEFAKSGRVACQLNSFISYFLDEHIYMERATALQTMAEVCSNRRKRKRQYIFTDRNSEAGSDKSSDNWEVLEGSDISPHCLINQAYAAAVRTLMQGNLASLNTVGASVMHRRQNSSVGQKLQMPESVTEDVGFVFSFGCGDITLLELFLHTHRQREHLQVLAGVCKIDVGDYQERQPIEGLNQAYCITHKEENGLNKDPGDLESEMETYQIKVSRNFKEFPRGADLLTYLFVKLQEADTLHLELLRFLFERACKPYTEFIHSWLYHATVQDPFHEFIVKPMPPTGLKNSFGASNEQVALSFFQVRKGVSVPCFLEEVCTPLLRAGQQLQVLSKVLENRQLALDIVGFPLASTGSAQDSPIGPSLLSDSMESESTLRDPMLHFTQKRLQNAMEQRERRSQNLKVHHDRLFAELASSCFPQDEDHGSDVKTVPSRRRLWKSSEQRGPPRSTLLEKVSKAKVKSPRGSMSLAVLRMGSADDTSVGSRKETGNDSALLQPPVLQKRKSRSGSLLNSRSQDNMLRPPIIETKTSYISDFQRGTSWPMWGLPRNPFLSYNHEVNTPFRYTLTNFPEKNGGWDVAVHWGDPPCISESPSRVFKELKVRCTVDQRPGLQNSSVLAEESDWFTKMEESFKGQLTRGLDEQILQAHYESLGYEFERENGYWSPYSLGSQLWGYSTSLNLAVQQGAGRRLQTNPQWELVDSSTVDSFEDRYFIEDCKLSRKFKDADEIPMAINETSSLKSSGPVDASLQEEDMGNSGILSKVFVQDSMIKGGTNSIKRVHSSCHKTQVIDEIEPGGSSEAKELLSDAGEVDGGANWETYLGCEHQRFVNKGVAHQAPLCEDIDDEEIPLVVAVNQCIVQEILLQYKCTSMLTVRLLQEILRLPDHCTALRRYYFMETGDWAEYFMTALCKYDWNRLGGQPRLLEVQSMLVNALQNSSCDGDEYAERLFIIQNTLDGHSSSLPNPTIRFFQHARFFGTFVNWNNLDAFDFIKMGYKVDWPLSLIITPSAVTLYSSIFTFLMRTKLTMYSLAEIWRYLQVIGHSLDKGRQHSDYQEQNKKFRTLQLFRQQIGHVVTTIQRYTESQLLHVVWSRYLNSVENEVKDIHDLEKVHLVYLEDACHQCFLSSDMEDVKSCIDTIMQCTLDFRAKLVAASIDEIGNSKSISDDLFDKVLGVKCIFERHLHKLYLCRRMPEPQYSVSLTDFWMCLDFNGFLSHSQAIPSKVVAPECS